MENEKPQKNKAIFMTHFILFCLHFLENFQCTTLPKL